MSDQHGRGDAVLPLVVTSGEYSDYRILGVFMAPAEMVLAHVGLVEKHNAQARASFRDLRDPIGIRSAREAMRLVEQESLLAIAISPLTRVVKYVELWDECYDFRSSPEVMEKLRSGEWSRGD